MLMKILFIGVGGTIDKDYREGAGVYNFVERDPRVKDILKKANPSIKYRSVSLVKKDSMDLTDEDRGLIVRTCQQAPEKHIVITHGTDTMHITGEALDKVIKNKTIVLTGAARPDMFSNSDAAFNVGSAVGAINVLSDGVYIAMNGRVLPWDKIRKDPITGVFSEI